MPKKAPRPEAGNSPQGLLEPPEPVVDAAPVVDVTPAPEVTPEVAPVPDTTAPGVYTNGVLTANVVDGAIVAIPAATVTPETTATL